MRRAFRHSQIGSRDNRDFGNIEDGLRAVGMDAEDVSGIMGGNWYRFYSENFSPRP